MNPLNTALGIELEERLELLVDVESTNRKSNRLVYLSYCVKIIETL